MPRPKKNPDEPRKPSKKWDYDEIIQIIMYLKDVISKGRELEKPTPKIFYERMIYALNIKDATVAQLSYKVSKMKESYNQASTWQRKTGAGVESGSVKAHLNNMCEHFDLLEEIYSAKANVNPPYTYESASTDSAGVATTYNNNADFDPSDIIVYDPEDEFEEPWPWERNSSSTAKINTTSSSFARSAIGVTNSKSSGSVSTTNTSKSLAAVTVNVADADRVETSSRCRTPSPGPEDTVSRFKRSRATIPVTKSVKSKKLVPDSTKFVSNSSTVTLDWQKQRADAIAEKNRILSEKHKLDEKWKEKEINLAKDKFDFEKDFRNKEIDLKKLEIEKEERLKKLEIEKEEKIKKMEIEKEERLAMLKMEYEYKFQLQLTNRNK